MFLQIIILKLKKYNGKIKRNTFSPKDKNSKENENLVSSLSPREIVSELDRFVVGQNKAKKAVAVALKK